jgi:hypothetical protein
MSYKSKTGNYTPYRKQSYTGPNEKDLEPSHPRDPGESLEEEKKDGKQNRRREQDDESSESD